MIASEPLPVSIAAKPPASDVTPWVGLIGLIMLLACILIARSWPEIELAFGFHTERGRLSGPSAALLPMLFLALFAGVVTLVAARLFRWETA